MMIRDWLRNTVPRIFPRRKLIVVAFDLPDRSSHFFNELLGYKHAADALGIGIKIFVPQRADTRLVTTLGATAILDRPPRIGAFDPAHISRQLDSFFDTAQKLDRLWAAIEAEDLSRVRAILFPQPHAAVIRAAGAWLGRHPAHLRPAVFFRFPSGFIKGARRVPDNRALFRRLAGKDLKTRPGQERVFFLVNARGALGSVMRVCDRRAFLMPTPKHFGSAVADSSTQPQPTTIYIHLNRRSGVLIDQLVEIVRRVKAVHPSARFLVKFTLDVSKQAPALDGDIAGSVEMLPSEQSAEDYLRNLQRCSVALLAYTSNIYTVATSGVFVELVALGKPVIVPAGSWMADELAAGRGVGTVFATPTPESVAVAVVEALRSYDQLSPAATKLAPALREENSCRRVLESMLALASQTPDMEPIYLLGEEIDFRDPFDSRCFMRNGWSITDKSGAWTEGRFAELALRLDAEPSQPLVLRARVEPFLTEAHNRLRVRVSCLGQPIAKWLFMLDSAEPNWRLAKIPPRQTPDQNRPLDITFAIDAPRSPAELGLSEDRRRLGLNFISLSISAAKADRAKRKTTHSIGA